MGKLFRLGAVLREMAAPSTPASGTMHLYGATDHRPYVMNDGGQVSRLDNTMTMLFSDQGVLAVGAGVMALPILFPGEIEAVGIRVTTAPTGATLIVDVNKNGTTIYGTQANRPTIAISGTSANGGAMSVVTLASGDYLTVDIDQVGSTVAGSNLVAAVMIRRTG